MSEAKKEKENKKEKQADSKSDSINIEKQADNNITKTTKQGEADKKIDGLEELPEEVRKRLEKKEKVAKRISKKKKKKHGLQPVSVGKAFIKSTYNNTIVTLTDLNGNVISWASAGLAGFKGPKKATPYAAQVITRIAVEKAKQRGLTEVSIFVKGVGTGRESAIRAINANNIVVTSIKDVTQIPYNGCRKRKPRKV